MKEIGLRLKNKRISNGISLEEAAEDLKMRVNQLESVEEGREEDFKDVLSLKLFIRDYAKYLGLDGEEMLDSFNEYLFEQTSKISLEEIEQAKRDKEEKEKDMKILSPYTVTSKDVKRRKIIIICIVIFVLLLIIGYIFVRNNHGKDDFIDGKISYVE
ncbi:MAG: helix-turn-helix domain-containing protein [Bacilli bacterium]|nr:helix-turn-helix domain-containing protein [Bacilli bacterium]